MATLMAYTPVAEDVFAIVCKASQSQVDLWLVHFGMVCQLPNKLGDDVALGVIHSLARALCEALSDFAAIAEYVRIYTLGS